MAEPAATEAAAGADGAVPAESAEASPETHQGFDPAEVSNEVFVDLTRDAGADEPTDDVEEAEAVVAEDEPSGTVDGATEAGAEPTPEGETPEAVDGAQPEEAEAAGEETSSEPFTFRVEGTEVPVEGAYERTLSLDDGSEVEAIVLPKEQWQRTVQPRLVDPGRIAKERRALEQKIAELDPEQNPAAINAHPEVVRAKTLLAELDKALDSPDGLRNFLTNFDLNRERIQDKVALAQKEAEAEVREQRDARAEQDAQVEVFVDAVVEDIPTAVDTLLEQAGDVPEAVKARFKQHVFRDPARYYVIGSEDNQARTGLRPGEFGRNNDLLVRELADMMQLANALGTTGSNGSGTKADVEAVRKKNRAALEGDPAPAATPTPKATPAPTTTTEATVPKDKDEWRRWKRGG